MPTPTTLPVTHLSHAPTTDPVGQAADVTNGNSVANSGGTILRLNNTDTVSHTVTFHIPETVEGQAVTDYVVTVPASTKSWVSGFNPAHFGAVMKITANNALVLLTAFDR